MNIFIGILCIAAIIFVILWWEMIYCIAGRYLSKPTINDIKENIIECLDKADELGYVVMFRTPECVAYKNYKLHIAKTEAGKEVIMADLI